MPRTIENVEESKLGSCDPRCGKHAGRDDISPRVRTACARNLDLEDARRHARESMAAAHPPSSETSIAAPRPAATDFAARITALLAEPRDRPERNDDRGDNTFEDVTMPTLGYTTLDDHPFSYGKEGNGEEGDGEESDEQKANNDVHLLYADLGQGPRPRTPGDGSEASFELSEYGLSPTESEYNSASEDADIDTDTDIDIEAHNPLDDLIPISQGPSRPITPQPAPPEAGRPVLDMDPPRDEQAPEHRQPSPDHPQTTPTPPPKALPHALRAFSELILKQSSTGNLTVQAAESLLKTLNMCLEKDFLRCGPDSDPEHRLPLTLETLKHQACNLSELFDNYAVCPDYKCQTLKSVKSMDSSKETRCEQCDKPITKRKILRRRARKTVYRHVPILLFTGSPIEQQLKEILSRPGIQEAIQAHRAHLRWEGKDPGTYEDIQDAEMMKNLKKDGVNLFDNPDNIGLILMSDGFQPNSRRGSANYSAGAISLCIANLPPHLRVRPENKILLGITPGPKEPDVDTIHNFLKPIVDQLLKFWNEGMEFVDPDGTMRIIRAALIACVCDSPEARKLGGFPGNGATYRCTVCWCSQHELHMFETVFGRRTCKQHKRASKRYQKLPNQNQRDKFIKLKYTTEKPGGYRYSELLRLPYWDPTKMVVVDAMHCLFLGLVKWQFHEVWIKMKHLRPKSELDELQKMVQSTLRPRHCGKPPHALGTEAGGSLTADPLRSLVSIDLPLAIPVIWDTVDTTSVEQRAHEEWAHRKQKREENKAKRRKGDKKTREAEKARQRAEGDEESPPPPPRKRQRKSAPSSKRKHHDHTSEGEELPEDARVMDNAEKPAEDDAADRSQLSWRKQDAEGILLLASAIKYLCARTVSQENIKKGEEYLKRYLVLLAQLRGNQRMCPNHHYLTHIPMSLSLYGPMGGIWTYSGERLNYDLKHTNNNSRGGGERELTFATGFHLRRLAVDRLTRIAANKEDPLRDWAEYTLALDHLDVRGTFAAEAADAQTTNSQSFKRKTHLSHEHRQALGSALRRIRPDLPFRYKAYEESDHPVLDSDVKSVREVTLNGRTYSMASLRNGIVKVYTVEDDKEAVRVGEILDIWEHTYYSLSLEATVNTFALVRWYQTSTIFAPRSARLWLEEFEHLDIDIHPRDRYIERHAVIPVTEICCHCARMSATVDGKSVWLTIPVERE